MSKILSLDILSNTWLITMQAFRKAKAKVEAALIEAAQGKLMNYKAKLDVWRNGQLKRYDSEPSIRADRNNKYHDRLGYVTFLDKTISDKLNAERAKMQAKWGNAWFRVRANAKDDVRCSECDALRGVKLFWKFFVCV